LDSIFLSGPIRLSLCDPKIHFMLIFLLISNIKLVTRNSKEQRTMSKDKIIKFWASKIRFCGWFYWKTFLTITIFTTNSSDNVHDNKNFFKGGQYATVKKYNNMATILY
jgi:hypothetical protein